MRINTEHIEHEKFLATQALLAELARPACTAETALALIKRGANVNARDFKDSTPLLYAVRWGLEDVVEVLLRKGADPNAHDRDGVIGIVSAAFDGNARLTAMLLRAGADPSLGNRNGHTAQYMADQWKKEDVAATLKSVQAEMLEKRQAALQPRVITAVKFKLPQP